MKFILLVLNLSAFYGVAICQTTWLLPQMSQEDVWCLVDVIQQDQYSCDEETYYHNYNPIFQLESTEIVREISRKNGLNIYTVYRTEQGSQEQFIWGLSSKNVEQHVLTDYRLANLVEGKVMNFVDFKPGGLYINSFLDYESGLDSLSLQVGGHVKRQDLPISASKVYLAELIAFEKPLSPLGKSILESSLALKYSITLAPGTDYVLSADQRTRWDAKQNRDFHNNIAGIAVNDGFRLNQKQSASAIEKGTLSIGYMNLSASNWQNDNVVPAGCSLIWGDNEDPLKFISGDSGIPILQRKWLLENSGFGEENIFQLSLEEELITKQIPADNFLWMKVTQGQYSRLYCADQFKQFKTVQFFDGSQLIEFINAPQYWAHVTSIDADCERGKNGAITIQVVGVSSPYTIQLISSDTQDLVFDDFVSDKKVEVDNLAAGKYSIRIIRDDKILCTQEVNIKDVAFHELEIPAYYVFDKEDHNVIDASQGMTSQWQYEWSTPQGEQVYNSVIEFQTSGIYWLKVYNETCFSYTQVDVQLISSNIKSVKVFPNPSSNGLFHFKLELEDIFDVHVTICDITGRVLFSKDYNSKIFIDDHIQLHKNGMYFLTCSSGSSSTTKKLLVQLP